MADEVIRWTVDFLPKGRTTGIVFATFIIDTNEDLWIADRRSEHVACADGQDVLAAGEIAFERSGTRVEVLEITNQSTGYCPEPGSWAVVDAVLKRLGIAHPAGFQPEFEFRRCDGCGTTSVIKDGAFECAVCGAALSLEWNFGEE